jgi:hypothetical protein
VLRPDHASVAVTTPGNRSGGATAGLSIVMLQQPAGAYVQQGVALILSQHHHLPTMRRTTQHCRGGSRGKSKRRQHRPTTADADFRIMTVSLDSRCGNCVEVFGRSPVHRGGNVNCRVRLFHQGMGVLVSA